MTALRSPVRMSVEDYLAGELVSEIKSEFLGGEVHAMAGVGNRHNEIATNVTAALSLGLRGKSCRAFNSDTKIRIGLANQIRFYYPDAMVVCDQNRDTDSWQDRPVVIVEVLSESTRRTDLTEKREAYLTTPSLQVLMLVEPDEAIVVAYRRAYSGDFLKESYFGVEAIVPLNEVGIDLALAEVYERIEF